MAAAVTVGNERLADFARRYNPAVTVVPSTVSLREYRPRPQPAGGAMQIVGWTGSHSSAQYLRLVEGALQTLARRRRFRFLVIGLDDYRLAGVDVECRAWNAETEVEDLWPMDVGTMPLFDDPWARGKCAMKAIQYMGVGLPAVVSPSEPTAMSCRMASVAFTRRPRRNGSGRWTSSWTMVTFGVAWEPRAGGGSRLDTRPRRRRPASERC